MNELIESISKETGLEFYIVSRPQGVSNCIVYNSTRSGIVSDGRRELSKYNFYFLLICKDNDSKKIKSLEDALYNNMFTKISIQQTLKTEDGNYQTSVTGTKILK